MENIKPITIADLIQHLKSLPPDMLVAYQKYSESCLLEISDIELWEMQPPRPDGWVHGARPDEPKQTYLMLPGN